MDNYYFNGTHSPSAATAHLDEIFGALVPTNDHKVEFLRTVNGSILFTIRLGVLPQIGVTQLSDWPKLAGVDTVK